MANPFDQFDTVNPFDQFDAPPASAADVAGGSVSQADALPEASGPASQRGLADQVGAGAFDALATVAGAPGDLAQGAVNLGVRGINAVTGSNINEGESPIGSAAIKRGMGAIGGINPDTLPANTTQEQIARGVGSGAGMMAGGGAVVAGALRAGVGALYPRTAQALNAAFGTGATAPEIGRAHV